MLRRLVFRSIGSHTTGGRTNNLTVGQPLHRVKLITFEVATELRQIKEAAEIEDASVMEEVIELEDAKRREEDDQLEETMSETQDPARTLDARNESWETQNIHDPRPLATSPQPQRKDVTPKLDLESRCVVSVQREVDLLMPDRCVILA
jgi:hypothetical protein